MILLENLNGERVRVRGKQVAIVGPFTPQFLPPACFVSDLTK